MSPWCRCLAMCGCLAVMLAVASPVAADALVDHSALDRLLRRYVVDGWVDYVALQQERQALYDYVGSLAAARPEQWIAREAQLAFWINAYNACVVKGVLDHYPVASVRDIRGFFDGLRYEVAGEMMTLNQIEEHARASGDWRVHAALVCAAASCPPLRAEAYQPERLEAQLADQTARFLADPARGLRLDQSRRTLWVSKIVQWYADEIVPRRPGAFSGVMSEALAPVLAPYLEGGVAQALQAQRWSVRFMAYDWALNDAARRTSESGRGR